MKFIVGFATNIHLPRYCTVHVNVVCDSVWSVKLQRIFTDFLLFVYMAVGDYQKGWVEIPLTGVNNHMFVSVPNQVMESSTNTCRWFFVFTDLR